MITTVDGKLASSGTDWVDVNLGGITIRISVPSSTKIVSGEIGDPIQLFTSLQTREDSLTLYGFQTVEERSTFEALILVNGIGPRLALGILSNTSPDTLAIAVASADIESLKQIPGVGTRTANRIVLELKGKLDSELRSVTRGPENEDLIEGLSALGYTSSEILGAIASLPDNSDLSLEEELRLCIQHLGGN